MDYSELQKPPFVSEKPEFNNTVKIISRENSPDYVNKKLLNSKFETLSDDAKHYVDSMKGYSKNIAARRKVEDKLLVEFIYLFQEYPEISDNQFASNFNKAKQFYFNEFAPKPELKKQMNSETFEWLVANRPSKNEVVCDE